MTVKKISGKFRNMQSRCRVLYSSDFGADGFSIADPVRTVLGEIYVAFLHHALIIGSDFCD